MPSKNTADGQLKNALDPIATAPSFAQKLTENVTGIITAPLSSYRSTKMLSDLAPTLMTSKLINAATTASTSRGTHTPTNSGRVSSVKAIDFATLGRAPGRLSSASRRLTSTDLEIKESTPELLSSAIPSPDLGTPDVSLLQGFNATIPSSERGKLRRRKARHVETPHMGLKQMGLHARGLLTDEDDSIGGLVSIPTASKSRPKRPRESLSAAVRLGKEELEIQSEEIRLDQEHVEIRRKLLRAQLDDIDKKVAELHALRRTLEEDLLQLEEEELELQDEFEGVHSRLAFEEGASNSQLPRVPSSAAGIRRRKGPAFFPSEHDDLPPGIAFMTLRGHQGAICALDFSEPYGTLVSSSTADDGGARVWDLGSGEELGRLRIDGSSAIVKCIQVEDMVCVTGASNGEVNMWDLRRVGLDTPATSSDDILDVASTGTLHGHTQAVSALYLDDDFLVSGACDKTIRQWDVTTGQCVMTMDILWAISHPPPSRSSASSPFSPAPVVGTFSVPISPLSDGSWDLYEDFVGALQSWKFALVSGSGDSAVRMWDMRTGQAHRTLMGHTGPVTCLQFDETHIVSGSLDKTIRIWDLRTGGISDTIRCDYPVFSLQFDSRKIVAAAGENSVKIYNRTSMQVSSLTTNGHTSPCERVRYMDRYLVSGGRDSCVKVWAL